MFVCQKGVCALAVAVALISAGCGFSLSGPDPQRPRYEMPKCDTGKGAVVIDGLMATVAGIVALTFIANDLAAPALIPAGIGAAYLGGAVHGSRAVDECRAAMSEWSGGVEARDTLARTPPSPRSVEEEITADAAEPPRKLRPVAPLPPAPVQAPAQPPSPDQAYPKAQDDDNPATQQPPAPVQQPPAQQPPAQQPVKKKMPPSRPAPSGDEWGDFWREVR